MSKSFEGASNLRRRLLFDNIFPTVIFFVSVLFMGLLLQHILPENLFLGDSIGEPVILGFGSANIGMLSLCLYYFEWRRYWELEVDKLAVKLLNTAVAWFIHNMIILYTVTIFDSADHPVLLIYILFLIALYFWGSGNFRLRHYLVEDSPPFIVWSILLSQLIFVISILPTLGYFGFFMILIITCGCN